MSGERGRSCSSDCARCESTPNYNSVKSYLCLVAECVYPLYIFVFQKGSREGTPPIFRGKMGLYCQACFKASHVSFHRGRRQESLACLLLANLKRWIPSVSLTLATVLNGSNSPGHCFNLKVIVVLTLTEHLKIQADLLLNRACYCTLLETIIICYHF